MAEYRLMADTWIRMDPATVDDKSPKVKRHVRGDVIKGITDDEVDYLTNGARPMLVEVDSDADPFKKPKDQPAAGDSPAPGVKTETKQPEEATGKTSTAK